MRVRLTARAAIGGALIVAVITAAFVLLLVAVGDQNTAAERARHAEEAIGATNDLEKLTVDVETGLRGYQITHTKRFLAPLLTARKALPRQAAALKSLLRGDPRGLAAADLTVSKIDSYITGFVLPQIREIAHELPADDVQADVISATEGKRRLDVIRGLFDRVASVEEARANDAHKKAHETTRTAIGLVVASLVTTVVLLLLFGWSLVLWVIRPLRRVSLAARRLGEGDLGARVDPPREPELGALARSFNAMADSLAASRDELEQQNAELEAQQTELERAFSELEEGKERIERFEEFARRVTSKTELEPLASTILGELADIAGAEAGALYAISSRRDAVAHVLATNGVARAELPPAVGHDDGQPGRAISEGLTVSAAYPEDALPESFGGQVAVRHEIDVPLFVGDRTIGVIALARIDDRPFAPSDVLAVEYLARQAAVALANVVSLHDAQRQAAINRAVLETATDAFVATDCDGCITAWNRRAEATFGWSRGEAIGSSLQETALAPAKNELERDRAEFTGTGKSPMTNSRVELVARDRDGREFPVELTISPLMLDGEWNFNAFIRDVSDRKRSERYVAAQYAVTQALAEASDTATARQRVLDALGTALDFDLGAAWGANEKGTALHCLSTWNASGEPSPFEESTRAMVLRPDEGLTGRVWNKRGPTWVEDAETEPGFLRAGAARSQGLHSGFVLPVTSDSRGVIGLLEFWTHEPRQADPELNAMLATVGSQIGQYIERRLAEVEADRMKDEFFALVSHELRTPLTSISGYLELVLEEPEELDEQTRRFLEVVERNAKRLLRLVGDLLFVAQVEAGTLSIEQGTVHLPTAVAEAVEAARPRAEEHGISLRLNAEAVRDRPGDPDRIGQALDNLVSNAVKFTPEGGSVEVSLRRDGDEAVIEVSDTGIGIPAGDQERLFERFFRSSTASVEAIPGVGLGLTIVKAIVEAHGGEIAVKSEQGEGTVFTVSLPVATGQGQAAEIDMTASGAVL